MADITISADELRKIRDHMESMVKKVDELADKFRESGAESIDMAKSQNLGNVMRALTLHFAAIEAAIDAYTVESRFGLSDATKRIKRKSGRLAKEKASNHQE